MSNALLMSSATAIVRSGGLFWLKHVVMVLFMLDEYTDYLALSTYHAGIVTCRLVP